jgi:hypothetical protein
MHIKAYCQEWCLYYGARDPGKNFWMGRKPKTMSEFYSHLFEELELRLVDAAQVCVGFVLPACIAPSCSRILVETQVEVAA